MDLRGSKWLEMDRGESKWGWMGTDGSTCIYTVLTGFR
jgi:hypothetical protein